MSKVQLLLILTCLFILKTFIVKANSIPSHEDEIKIEDSKNRDGKKPNTPSTENCGNTLVNTTTHSSGDSSNRQTQQRQEQHSDHRIQAVDTALKTHNISETHSNLLKNAIINEDINEIRHLLQIVDVNNIRYDSGVTPLHLALYHSVEILELFIKAGANIDTRDHFGNTSLYIVNTLEKARMLLRAGADPSAKNNHGATPLYYAHAKMTKFLIEEANVNVHAKDNFGYTSLDYAINQIVMNKLVEEVRSRDDAMGQHYLGNRFQAFSSGLHIALRKPTEMSEMKTKINTLVSAGATLSIENPEVINILNTLTSTEEF